MHTHIRPVKSLLLFLVTFVTVLVPLASCGQSKQTADLSALGGEWLYVEDRTEGRSSEKHGPPMSVKFVLRIEKDAVVHERTRGDERIPLDGSETEVNEKGTITTFRGKWHDGVFKYETDVVRENDKSRITLIQREFRTTPEGLLVRVSIGSPAQLHGVALYRHPKDIPLPAPAKAKIDDLAWLAGPWVGSKGTRSIEERWSPPLAGSILGVSRTVSRGKMVAFEYLRIVERDGGLIYIAQPGGRSPTEFVLTQLNKTRAVFENPRHDSPQRIVYELSTEDRLTASIGFINGGSPQQFEFTRESK